MTINFDEWQKPIASGDEMPTDEDLGELYDKYEHYEDM